MALSTRLRTALVSGVVSSVLLAACRTPPPPFDPDDPAVVAAIESRLQAAMDGAAKVDAGQVVAGFGDDATFLAGDVMLSGLTAIRTQFADTYAGLASQKHTIREKRVRVLAPDAALVTATGDGTYTDAAGWTSQPVGLGITIVFVRQDGVWRAVHAHQSIGD
jgi:uncharacterized protein (TIGR02246 family)